MKKPSTTFLSLLLASALTIQLSSFTWSQSTVSEDSIRKVISKIWNLPAESRDKKNVLRSNLEEHLLSIPESNLKADAYDAIGDAFEANGELDSAKHYFSKAIAFGEKLEIHERVAWSSNRIASVYLAENRVEEAEKYLNDAHKLFLKIGNDKMAIKSIYMLTSSGMSNYADTLISNFTKKLDTTTIEGDKVKYLLVLSNVCTQNERRNHAMNYSHQALKIAEAVQDTIGLIQSYYQIASYFSDYQQNYDLALTYFEKILTLKLKKKADAISDLYNQMGELHRLTGNDSLAFANFKKALDFGKKKKHRHSMASAYLKLGDFSYHIQQYDDALFYYNKCYKTGCETCPQIKFHDALVNTGNVYLNNGNLDKASEFYTASLDLADSAADFKALAYSNGAIGEMHEKTGDYSAAKVRYLEAFDISKNANFLEGQSTYAMALSELYKKQEDFKNAHHFLHLANLLSDSISNINEADNLAKLETHFEFSNLVHQNELENIAARQEIGRQKLYRNFFTICFALLFVAAFFIYRDYNRKRKDNKLLTAKNETIAAMAQKIHEADQAKLRFFTNVSHELKTPLTLIIGMTDRLKQKMQGNQQLAVVRKNALKLVSLINHLLDLRKLDESKMQLCVSPGNINKFISGIVGAYQELIDRKELTVDVKSNRQSIEGYFDHEKLEKIFSNLLSNAIKYSPAGGTVSVKISVSKEDLLQLKVTDQGPGISQADVSNIFDRFYRTDENTQSGTGIGLALAKELAEIHKGTVEVESKEGAGATFTVSIPAGKKDYSAKEIDDKMDSQWGAADLIIEEDEIIERQVEVEHGSKKQSILIVEDNQELRGFLAEIFCDDFAVLEAKNGDEGLSLASNHIPDIIISDIVMPGLSGIELVEQLKKQLATSHIPVILLTAKTDLSAQISGFDVGADDYINKPFDSQILQSRVHNLLRQKKRLAAKFSQHFQLEPKEITIEDADQQFLKDTIAIIEKYISNTNLNIDLLAMELGVSRTQLYRKLKALTDYSANQFIRIIRLKRAAQILQQGQNNIAEVMDATGFSNYSYFNNCFKEYFGESPKDYELLSVKENLN